MSDDTTAAAAAATAAPTVVSPLPFAAGAGQNMPTPGQFEDRDPSESAASNPTLPTALTISSNYLKLPTKLKPKRRKMMTFLEISFVQ